MSAFDDVAPASGSTFDDVVDEAPADTTTFFQKKRAGRKPDRSGEPTGIRALAAQTKGMPGTIPIAGTGLDIPMDVTRWMDDAPSAGAMIGSVVPGFGTFLGAATGNAAKQIWRQNITMADPEPSLAQSAGSMLFDATLNKGLEVGGGWAAKKMAGAVPELMERGLKLTKAVRERFPQLDFIRAALEENVPFRHVPGQAGVGESIFDTRASQSNDVADALVDQAVRSRKATTTTVTSPQSPLVVQPHVPNPNAPVAPSIPQMNAAAQNAWSAQQVITQIAERRGLEPAMLIQRATDDLSSMPWLSQEERDLVRQQGQVILEHQRLQNLQQAAYSGGGQPALVPGQQRAIPVLATNRIAGTAPANSYMPGDVSDPILAEIEKLRRVSSRPGRDTGQMEGMLSDMTDNGVWPHDPAEERQAVRYAQSQAEPAYRAQARGEPLLPEVSNEALFNFARARGGNAVLRRDIPGYKDANAMTQRFMALAEAYANAEKLGGPAVIPNPLARLYWELTSSPEALRRTAMAFNNPATQDAVKWTPRMLNLVGQEAVSRLKPGPKRVGMHGAGVTW